MPLSESDFAVVKASCGGATHAVGVDILSGTFGFVSSRGVAFELHYIGVATT